MSGQRGQLGKLFGRVLVTLAATVMAAVLLTPVAVASPIGEAEEAMMAAWEKAGGDSSPLGARKGDVYPAGQGFALDFTGGKMYFTAETGAKFVYGPILEKYESAGGPVSSDLGFPTINEVPGLAGPDSRVATFSASDKPVIYWTPDHGAHVVRGALNAAWDKLGSSDGALGVPVGDETYDGDVTSQKFSRGAISWNRKTNQFTTEPAVLGDQLKDLKVQTDPAAAINMAWRAAGGAAGPLGAKKGGQYPIGGDGIAQDFAGGKVYYSPATGANAVESDILAKYESLGGPVGSELGFPIANESDGAIAPSSRIAVFSGPDKPVIYWTPDHGAFVVRGAMKAAWDKLKGPTGKLGAPVGDQAVDGDAISQKFTGGTISWNRATNTFTTDPANLAPLLAGLQVPGQNQPSGSAMPAHAKKFAWHWWYLVAIIALLMLLFALGLVLTGWRRRRRARDAAFGYDTPAYESDHGPEPAYDVNAAEPWAHEEAEFASQGHPLSDAHPPGRPEPEELSPPKISWPRSAATAMVPEDEPSAGAYGHDLLAGPDTESREDVADGGFDEQAENPDDVDTTSIPVLTDAGFPDSGIGTDNGFASDVAADTGMTDDAFAESPAEAGYSEEVFAEAPAGAAYSEEVFAEAPPDTDYPQDVFAEAPPDTDYPRDVFAEAPPDAAYSEEVFTEEAGSDTPSPEVSETPEVPGPAASAVAQFSGGRHAAVDADAVEEAAEAPEGVGGPPVASDQTQPARPTIHLPLDDPYLAPDGYPVKASARFGLYYTPESELYEDTLAEIWLASAEVAEANGFTRAD